MAKIKVIVDKSQLRVTREEYLQLLARNKGAVREMRVLEEAKKAQLEAAAEKLETAVAEVKKKEETPVEKEKKEEA
ncbi:hypothetical protein CW700_01130 [Candidatus Bathyarchaeota archaeon]|nr:MAG: hypothetical protein CW700_01130 [Candidatus Bathyarchaeota archaeon]